MAFKPAAGYGDMFTTSTADMRAMGFEVQNFAKPIMRYALDQLVFSRFMNPSADAFGKGKGGTFINRFAKDFGAVSAVSALTAGTAIGVGTQKWDSVSMVVNEYGTGVGYEGFADLITDIDLRNEIVTTLGRHVGRMIEFLDYSIFVNSTFTMEVRAAGSYSSIFGTNRVLQATGYGELGVGGVALCYDSLRARLVQPITSRGLYAWVGAPETFRNLKSGSVFQNVANYSNMSGLTYQVLGEFNGFLFVETTENLNKGTSFAFGANVGGYGFGMLPRTFYYPDFGSDANRLSVFKTLFYRGQGAILRDKGTACIMVKSKSDAYDYGSLG